MKTLIKFFITAFIVMLLSELLSGIYVDSFISALFVALTLGILRILVKPILVLFTLPITILTLGLFLFIINAIIIQIAGFLIDGFVVSSIWWALGFSLLLSLSQSFIQSIMRPDK